MNVALPTPHEIRKRIAALNSEVNELREMLRLVEIREARRLAGHLGAKEEE